MIGQTIAGRYVLQHELGAGGMGTVYRAFDQLTEQTVAVKRLKPGMVNDELLERFRREGEALRDLNHPNIVKMLNALQDGPDHYLVMEYIPGGDLKTLIEQQPLDPNRCVDMAIDIADALTRAHRLKIIHRDLKPANILIAEDDTLRLTDFGVAYMGDKDRVTDTNALIGTLDYLPPESFFGDGFDERGDIWAFGVVLFEMISGQRPFQGDTVAQTVHAITTQAVPDLEALCPDAPVALIDLIYRMIERDPKLRIGSVRHVAATLEDIFHGRDRTPPPARFSTPTTQPTQQFKSNLPAQTTMFVGREHELHELGNLIQSPSVRLITLLAPGGMGKTRLALQAAENALSQFADGAHLLDLTPLSDPDAIPSALADVFDYQIQSGEHTPKQQILGYLSQKNLLLLIDNYEHLIDGASIVTDILNAAPHVKVLVTSRRRLNQPGETLFHLAGMDFETTTTPDEALDYAAVKLLLQSARRARPGFELTDKNLVEVLQLCQLVQGMPLGIVLAASWLATLSLREIVDELQLGMDFLETEATDLPARQRSIRTVMDYSWALMTEAEQQVFMRLSVFRGGFTREAAQVAVGASLRNLMSLVSKSLIWRDADTGRYGIHELLRQYAEKHLVQNELSEQARLSHATYMANLAEQARPQLRRANQEHWFKLLGTELENIRAALGWSLAHDYPTFAYRIISDLFDFWLYEGHHAEAATWLDKALPFAEQVPDDLHGRALTVRGLIAWTQHDLVSAETYTEAALSIHRQTGTQSNLAGTLDVMATILGVQDDRWQEALAYALEAQEISSTLSDDGQLALNHNLLGNAYHVGGDLENAVAHFQQSLALSEKTGQKRRVAMMYGNLSEIALETEDYEASVDLMKKSIRLLRELNFTYIILTSIPHSALLLAEFSLWEDATLLMGFYTAQVEELGIRAQPMINATLRSLETQLDGKLSAADQQAAHNRGAAMTMGEVLDFILNTDTEKFH